MTDSYVDQYGSDITQYPEASGYEAGSHMSELPFVKRVVGAAEEIRSADESDNPVQDVSMGVLGDLRGLATDAALFMLDPIGTLASAGLTIVLDLIKPLDDFLLWVSGDGGEMQRQIEVLQQVQAALSSLEEEIGSDVNSNITAWEGQAADGASNELGGVAASATVISGMAEDAAQLLDWARMTAEAIYEVIKAIIAELVIWLVQWGVIALASSVVTMGGSVASFLVSACGKASAMFMRAWAKFGRAQAIFNKIGGAIGKSIAKRAGWGRALTILSKAGVAILKTALSEHDSLLTNLSALNDPQVGVITSSDAGGYGTLAVEPEELRAAATALEGRASNIDAISTAAADAGAAEMTWGLTGLFFEQSYTIACDELVGSINSLGGALRGEVEKLNLCADGYEQADSDAASDLSRLEEGVPA